MDTTNGSSYGVSEWALALMLDRASQRRRAVPRHRRPQGRRSIRCPGTTRAFKPDELTGKTVGLIGCGIIGRRLLELLEPFHTTIYVYDPYVPRELADIYDITFTSLDNVLSLSDVVVCLAPDHARRPAGMLGAREFDLMRDGARLRQRVARRDRPDRRADRQAARGPDRGLRSTSSTRSRSRSIRRSATCATSS